MKSSRVISSVNLKQKGNVSETFSVSTIREWLSYSNDGDAEGLEALGFCVEMTWLVAWEHMIKRWHGSEEGLLFGGDGNDEPSDSIAWWRGISCWMSSNNHMSRYNCAATVVTVLQGEGGPSQLSLNGSQTCADMNWIELAPDKIRCWTSVVTALTRHPFNRRIYCVEN